MTDGNRAFHGLVLLTFLLMAVVTLLSAHMRLSGAGLGCTSWPACYGHTLSGIAPPRPDWISTIHRIAASLMGFTAIAIAVLAWYRRRKVPGDIPLVLALLGLTAFLAVLGKWTHEVRLPAVALGNLLGGLGMLSVLWRLHLGYSRQYALPSCLRGPVLLGLALIAVQITLGGMVSASFAASSCATGLSGCNDWLRHASMAAFNPFQMLSVARGNNFMPGETQQTLHMTHRLFALLVCGYLGWLGVRLLRENMRYSGMLLIAALILQIMLGICAVAFTLPLALVLMHNSTAAFLLLILVTLSHKPHQH